MNLRPDPDNNSKNTLNDLINARSVDLVLGVEFEVGVEDVQKRDAFILIT